MRRIDRDGDRSRAIGRADSGRDPLARLDRYGEGGLVPAAVVVDHRLKPERVGAVLGQSEADQPAPVPGHEVDRIRSRHLRGDDEVALILAVVVVDEDEHAAVARFVDDRFGADEHLGRTALDQLLETDQRVGGRIPLGRTELPQRIGMEAGSASQGSAADFAGFDDGVQALDQGGAHGSGHISHSNVIKRRNRCVPIARARRSFDRDSER